MTGMTKMAMMQRARNKGGNGGNMRMQVTDRNVGGRPVDDVGGKVYERESSNVQNMPNAYSPEYRSGGMTNAYNGYNGNPSGGNIENRRDSRGRYAPRNDGGYSGVGSMRMGHDEGWVVQPIHQEMGYRMNEDGGRMIGFEGGYDGGSMEMSMGGGKRSEQQMGHAQSQGRKPKHLDQQTAKEWVEAMGESFPMEKTMEAMKQRKCTCEPLEYWAICNAMKSDFHRTAMKYGMDKPDFYFDLAMDWLEDKDAKDGKAMLYYEHIVDV